jgi:murein DD-endopeptidase MepM/ murein hydrolase activator NlpD
LAEDIDAPASGVENEPGDTQASDLQTRRVRRDTVKRASTDAVARKPRRVRTVAPKPARRAMRPVRNLAILAAVAALIAGVALPAYGIFKPEAESVTMQEVAEGAAQSFTASETAVAAELKRDSYSATTPDEIAKKKAEEAAAERAKAIAAAAAANASANPNAQTAPVNVDLSMVAPGSGEVRWPLASYVLGEGFLARGGAHKGVDMLAPGGTPIYAAAAGVVRVSQDNFGGYGNAITIDSVVGGQMVSTLYAHIMYGGRHVSPGQTVEAGQMIAQVGSTGRSTANHLHFELWINGQYSDGYAWLQQNAG